MSRAASFPGHKARPTYTGSAHAEVALWIKQTAMRFRRDAATAADLDECCRAWLEGRGHVVTKVAPDLPDLNKGRKSACHCDRCSALDVWVKDAGSDNADQRITCHSCNHSYVVDGPDA